MSDTSFSRCSNRIRSLRTISEMANSCEALKNGTNGVFFETLRFLYQEEIREYEEIIHKRAKRIIRLANDVSDLDLLFKRKQKILKAIPLDTGWENGQYGMFYNGTFCFKTAYENYFLCANYGFNVVSTTNSHLYQEYTCHKYTSFIDIEDLYCYIMMGKLSPNDQIRPYIVQVGSDRIAFDGTKLIKMLLFMETNIIKWDTQLAPCIIQNDRTGEWGVVAPCNDKG